MRIFLICDINLAFGDTGRFGYSAHSLNTQTILNGKGKFMSTINVQRRLNMSQDEVKSLAEKVGKKLEKEYGVNFAWTDCDAVIKGPGVSGTCRAGDGEISIQLKLGFLAMAFKSRIEDEVNRYLDTLG